MVRMRLAATSLFLFYRVCQGRKYLDIDVSLTRFSMRLNHGWRQCRTVEAGRKDLQITNECPQVAVVCLGKSVNGRFFKFNALFTQDPPSNSAQGFIIGTNEVDFQQVFGEPVSCGPPR